MAIQNVRSRANGAHLEFYDQGTGTVILRLDDSLQVDVPTNGKFMLAGTAVTSTAAELNKLDGVTATYDELNYLDVTPGTSAASKAVVLDSNSKINALDITTLTLNGTAITSLPAELNILDGVTATYGQLNYVAVTPGTSAASKAVVLGATSKIDTIDVTSLKLNGTTVTATAAQLNALQNVASGTPVNAANASKVLTVGGVPLDNETVTVGAKTYTFQNAIGAGVAASGTLTVTDLPHDKTSLTVGTQAYRWRTAIGAGTASSGLLTVADAPHDATTVQVGTKTYTWRTAAMVGVKSAATLSFTNVAVAAETLDIDASPGGRYTWVTALTEAKAVSSLTLTGNFTDGNSVLIGATTYTFRETVGAAYTVHIGANAEATIDNLVAAINKAAGEGTDYGTGTVVHPTVTAVKGAADRMDITAKSIGVAGNAIDTEEFSSVASWTGAHMASGVDSIAREVVVAGTAEGNVDNLVAACIATTGSGTTFSSATTAHATCDVTKGSASTVVATAKSYGIAGDAITVAQAMTNATWSHAHLEGGVDVGGANAVLCSTAETSIDNLVLAITGGAGIGTNYGTGTTASTQVTAVKATAATMTVTALSVGIAGDLIDTITVADHCAFGAVTLQNGVDASVAYDVLAETGAEASIDNLVLAITAGAGVGVKYGTGTVAHTTATAVKATAATMTVTAKSTGDAGNAIATTTSADHCSFAAATLGGGEGVQAANDVLIGASAELSIDNLVAAITKGAGGEGVTYGNGTTANATATAAKASAATMSATALVAGTAGNAIVCGETLSNGSWAGAAVLFSGGVDGTVGSLYQLLVDATYLYFCTAVNTVADKNWRRIALGSAY